VQMVAEISHVFCVFIETVMVKIDQHSCREVLSIEHRENLAQVI